MCYHGSACPCLMQSRQIGRSPVSWRVARPVPTVGERFHLAGLEITIIDAEPARVNRVLVTAAGASAPVALELPR